MFQQLLYSPNQWMVLVWVLLIGVLLWRWQARLSSQLRHFSQIAIAIKLLATAVLVIYYGTSGGDLAIFWAFKVPKFLQLIDDNPQLRSELWGYLFWNDAETDTALQHKFGGQLYQYFNYPDAFEMHYLRLLALLHLLTMGNFASAVLIGGTVGLLGQWLVWRSVSQLTGKTESLGFVLLIGLPSVSVFTSGFYKETFLMFGLGLMLQGLLGRKYPVGFRLTTGGLGWLLMFSIKPYLSLTLLPFLGFVLVWRFTQKLSPSRRLLLRLTLLLLYLSVIVFAWDTVVYTLGYGRYLREVTLMAGSQTGNFVDIGQYELTPFGLLRAGSLGAMATLFGPLPHHINNLWGYSMLLENLIWVAVSGRLVVRRLLNDYRLCWQPAHWLLLVWPVCYCALLGISVPYYGSLLRYRTLALLLLVSGIYLLYATATSSKQRT